MKQSEIRGCCVAHEKPGLRFAPSGYKLTIWPNPFEATTRHDTG
jgi:hypothetical protein